MSLTVGEFERLAQVSIFRDLQPEVSIASRRPKSWSTQSPDTPMTPFNPGDTVTDNGGTQITCRQALERFKAAGGQLPEWAVGANATLGGSVTMVVTG
ncbi:MAG: hypothetical protein ACAI38_14975 [Myxococcota bacterium]|nr:hypothetical protein [Myxococcota bacterium]